MKQLLFFSLLFLSAAACNSAQPPEKPETLPPSQDKPALQPAVQESRFDTTLDGKPVRLYHLANDNGMLVSITNFGGRVVSLLVPGRDGKPEDVVQGFPSIEGYLNASESYFGATIGRYGNRIAKGRFTLQGKDYQLARNNGENHLHGGPGGFHNVVWNAEQPGPRELRLNYRSEDGEEGYPGTLYTTVTYELADDNILRINYKASTTKPTVVNLTHHSFFNLSGNPGTSINDHQLMINAQYYTPVDEGLIPTGEIAEVAGTPFDFRTAKPIGQDLSAGHEQLAYGQGYDHNFVLARPGRAEGELGLAAWVKEPQSGRVMEVWTNEPGLQFYGGNFLDGSDTGKEGTTYGYRTSFCLESQHFPDSPNRLKFPTTVLLPGQTYSSTCEYRFSAAQE